MEEFKNVSTMKFWCQKVLPYVYDDALSDYEVLCKVVQKLNETIGLTNNVSDFVENYFSNLDVQTEVDNKLQQMADSGELANIIKASYIKPDNHVCILIGDSYGVTTEWWQSWETIFSQDSGYTCYAIAVGGSGFIGDTSVKNFRGQLEQISSEVADKTTITDIIVIGGYNDASTNRNINDLLNAMSEFRSLANQTFPNAMIRVGFPSADYNNTGMQTKLNQYCDYYRTNCMSLGFAFIERMQYVLLNKSYLFIDSTNPNSGFHPNTNGNRALSNFLCKYMRNEVVDVDYSEAFAGVSVYTHNGTASLFPSTGYAFPLPAGTYGFDDWLTAVGLSTESNLIWGTDNPATCYYGVAPLIQNDGKFLGFLWWRIFNKELQVCNLGNTSGIIVVDGAFLALNGTCIPVASNY